jgi:hypothetical protein
LVQNFTTVKQVFMPFLVIFIFGAVVLGAGAMLAPAWDTRQPRIGLAAALALGLILVAGVAWTMLFRWQTLIIDYLVFGLLTVIFLGGTLSYGQRRAEARGETLADADQGWTGPEDLLFFALVGLIFTIPVLILPVPLDTDAQGFGYLGLLARLSGSFNTLAPWHPDSQYLYAPGFTLLTAYLSHQLSQGVHTVQFSVAAVLGLVLVWLAYDFGAELRDKRLGRMMALAMVAGLGLFTAFMDSHFTSLLGLVFALAFLIYALRYLRGAHWPDALAAGLMLAAVVLSHPDTTIILALGYVPWLLTMWLGQPRPTRRVWLVLALGIPALALVILLPWLANSRHLLGGDIVSPFVRNPDYWRAMVLYHGVWSAPAALIGAVVGLRKRDQAALLAVGWLILALEFASVGLLERLLPGLIAPLLRYDYPFSIAWHAPIIPYSILAGMALLWAWERWGRRWFGGLSRRALYAALGGLIALALLGLIFNRGLLVASKGWVSFFGAFASEADVRAMEWLRANTPPDARVLNFPGTQHDNSHEGDWVPVITERDSVYYRWQPFFRRNEASLAEQDRLRAFWEDPANPAHAALLKAAGIDYVIVPQIISDPASIATMFRWRGPVAVVPMRSRVADAPYLKPVFEAEGAQVYQVVGD